MGAEEGGGAGEGAAGAEVGHVAEGEPLQLLVLLQRAVLEPGLELCGLLRIKRTTKHVEEATSSTTGKETLGGISGQQAVKRWVQQPAAPRRSLHHTHSGLGRLELCKSGERGQDGCSCCQPESLGPEV